MAMLRPTQAVQTGAPGFVRGLLTGLVPLAQLIVGLVLSLTITAAPRFLIASQDFAVQQIVLPLVLGLSLLATIAAYAWGTVRTWQAAKLWRQAGELEQFRGAVWALGMTGILILLPFVLAVVWPQSPAVAK